MTNTPSSFTWDVSDVSTRYAPPRQMAQGLIATAPWINLVLLIIFFLLLPLNFVRQSVISVEMPQGAPEMGAAYGTSVVVLSMPGERKGSRHDVVFFDDRPFTLDDPAGPRGLERALTDAVAAHPDLELTIIADRRASHGTMTMLYTLGLRAGVQTIHIATSGRPEATSEEP